jgi:hypothetical protein
MNKKEIVSLLDHAHQSFADYLAALDEHDFLYAKEEKWSAGQQLDHIIKSVAPVNMAIGLPRFILKWKFGVANRPSKTYEAIVAKYKDKLSAGGRSTKQFTPSPISYSQKASLLHTLTSLNKKLCAKATAASEESLDKYILPHPLLGKLTLREMLYFTAYHVQHHQLLIQQALTENERKA